MRLGQPLAVEIFHVRRRSGARYRAPADFIIRGRGISEAFPLLVKLGPNENEWEGLRAYAAERRSRAAWLEQFAAGLERTDPYRVELREKAQVERDEADEIEALLHREEK
jgi:hypothetical protein